MAGCRCSALPVRSFQIPDQIISVKDHTKRPLDSARQKNRCLTAVLGGRGKFVVCSYRNSDRHGVIILVAEVGRISAVAIFNAHIPKRDEPLPSVELP